MAAIQASLESIYAAAKLHTVPTLGMRIALRGLSQIGRRLIVDTAKDTTMQHVTDVTIAEIKRAAEHPLRAPVIVRADAMLDILARIEQLESDLATAEQDSRQKQARIERLEKALALAQSRIERLEYDMKSGDYETLYAQAAAELNKLRAKGE